MTRLLIAIFIFILLCPGALAVRNRLEIDHPSPAANQKLIDMKNATVSKFSADAEGDIIIIGTLTASGLLYPSADGLVGESIITDGAGSFSVGPVAIGAAQSLNLTVRKGSAGTITKGQIVYISGYNVGQNVPEVELAKADAAGTMPAIGFANESLTNSANGIVIFYGMLSGVDTSTFAATDALYVSTTVAGGIVNTRPTGANDLVQKIGKSLRIHATLGTIQITGAGRSNDVSNSISIAGDIETTAGNFIGDLRVARIAGSTYSTVQDMQNTIHSAGWISGGGITDDTDGTITVAPGTGLIRATDTSVAEILFTNWAAESGANVSLTDASVNWIYVEYNSGTPRVIATVSERTDYNTNILLGIVDREGTTLHINEVDKHAVGDHANKMIRRLKDTLSWARVSGGIISETGTRNIAITAGSFWRGLTEFTTSAFDSSTADTFSYWHRDGGGGWTETVTQSIVNNTQYDDGDGTLGDLGNNRYGVHWEYVETDNDVDVIYGQGNYTLSQAEDAQPPAGLPRKIITHGFLIGKIIIKKSDSTFTQIESAFETTFSGSLAQDHGGLAGLTDDDHTQYVLIDGSRDLTGGTWGIGVTDSVAADVTFKAAATTSGAKATFENAGDEDGTVNSWIHEANGLLYLLGPDTDPDVFSLTYEGGVIVAGQGWFKGGDILGGLDDLEHGQLILYGPATGQGANIQLYNRGDDDTDLERWIIKADGTNLSIYGNTVDEFLFNDDGYLSAGTGFIAGAITPGASSDANLVAGWHFDEPSGTLDNYEGTAGYDLTTFNTPTYGATGRFTDALTFASGSSEYAEVDSGLGISAYPLTMMCWVKVTGVAAVQSLMWIGDKDASDSYLVLLISSEGRVELRAKNTSGQLTTSSVVVDDNNWHHVAAVYSSATVRQLYVDGVLVDDNNTTSVTIPPAIDRISIGRFGHTTPGSYFNGTIDEVAVYSAALTEAQIQTYYRNGARSIHTNGEAAVSLVDGEHVESIVITARDTIYQQFNGSISRPVPVQEDANERPHQVTYYGADIAGGGSVTFTTSGFREAFLAAPIVILTVIQNADVADEGYFGWTKSVTTTGFTYEVRKTDSGVVTDFTASATVHWAAHGYVD